MKSSHPETDKTWDALLTVCALSLGVIAVVGVVGLLVWLAKLVIIALWMTVSQSLVR